VHLIDTMVLSELRRRQRDPGAVAWSSRQRQEELWLSVVSIGEIERGLARQRTTDGVATLELKALQSVVERFAAERRSVRTKSSPLNSRGSSRKQAKA